MRPVPRAPLRSIWLAVALVVLTVAGTAFSQVSTSTPSRPDRSADVSRPASEKYGADLEILKQSLELTQREVGVLRAEVNNDLDRRFLTTQALGAILVILGLSSFFTIWKRLKTAEESILKRLDKSLSERVVVQIAKRIQGIDPTLVPVHHPRGLEREVQRLRRFGFANLIPYDKLDETCVKGVVIIHLSSDDGVNSPEVREFERFVETYSIKNSTEVGFLFYNTSKKSFPREIFDRHDIIDYSSSPTTLSANTMTVARNLVRFWDTSGGLVPSVDDPV